MEERLLELSLGCTGKFPALPEGLTYLNHTDRGFEEFIQIDKDQVPAAPPLLWRSRSERVPPAACSCSTTPSSN
ncbi:hypothetical protein [Limnoglobus roseus]|nr:hypothetical protein [Limnoglobus roseus]